MTNDIKAVSAQQLIDVSREAETLNLNRVLPDEAIKHLDPDGTSVVWAVMIHEHAQGQPTKPHYRCSALIKTNDRTDPWQTIIDVPIDTFKGWETVSTREAV